MRNVVSVLVVLMMVLMLSTLSPTPSRADIYGIDHGTVTAVHPHFDAADTCRVVITWASGDSTVDFVGRLAQLCNPFDVYYGVYLVVPVKDVPTIGGVGESLSRFEATGVPLNVLAPHWLYDSNLDNLDPNNH